VGSRCVRRRLKQGLSIHLRPIADHDCDHFEALQALHPSREQPINTHPDCIRELLTDPSINWNELVDTEMIRASIKRCPPQKASDRFGTRTREHLSSLFDDEQRIAKPFINAIVIPVLKGRISLDGVSTGLGAQILAISKPDNAGMRPVQVPDFSRQPVAASIMHKIVMKDPIVVEYLLNQNGNCIDSRVSQHALSKDGCLQVVKSVQMYIELEEIHEGAVPNSFEEDFPIFIQVNIKKVYPYHNLQLFLDLLAGYASCDYPDLKLRKGPVMTTIPNLRILLPCFAALYGKSTVMTYYHRRHTGRHVDLCEGSSQGCPTG
jgi:hypothetical protein